MKTHLQNSINPRNITQCSAPSFWNFNHNSIFRFRLKFFCKSLNLFSFSCARKLKRLIQQWNYQ